MPRTPQLPHQLDFDHCYRALTARDRRFDGQFVVTVRSTGIYCRPSCPSRTPKPENVDFVLTPAAAAVRGFRACRRCLPDTTPGSPRWNTHADIAARAMRLIADGEVDRNGVGGLATALGYTERHLSRVLSAELGAGTAALARTHRASTARTLLVSSDMSMSDVAFAAGFTSIRQFNDTIRELYGTTPTALRGDVRQADRQPLTGDGISLRLPFRPPYDRAWTTYGLASHAVPGLEHWDGTSFRRGMMLPHGPALAQITLHDDHAAVRLDHLDMRDLTAGVNRVRRLLDLDADPEAVDDVLSASWHLRDSVVAHPGIRLPGSVDGVETLIRVMLGQQVSVRAARSRISSLVMQLGDPVPWTDDHIERTFPSAAAIAEHGRDVMRGPERSVASIVNAAQACGESLELHPGVDASKVRTDLLRLNGVGVWTADQVVMRVTGAPDVLIGSDLIIARALSELRLNTGDTARWGPWRSYASMHLWRSQLAHLIDDTTGQRHD